MFQFIIIGHSCPITIYVIVNFFPSSCGHILDVLHILNVTVIIAIRLTSSRTNDNFAVANSLMVKKYMVDNDQYGHII